MSAIGEMVAEGVTAVPPDFLTDMTVNRALTRTFEIGDEFLDPRGLDAFDDDDAIYVFAFDQRDGGYLGSARLRPTTGPTMLRDAAPYLLAFGETIESPRIWELSRLCTLAGGRRGGGRRPGADLVVGKLAAAAFEVAGRAGVTELVCVADDAIIAALERTGCAPRWRPGPAFSSGSAPRVAVLDVGEIPLARVRKAGRERATIVAFPAKSG